MATTDRPFLDSFAVPVDDRFARFRTALREVPGGLTEWAVHPGLDDAPSRSADPGGWPVRAGDHAVLTSAAFVAAVADEGIVLTDHRELGRG